MPTWRSTLIVMLFNCEFNIIQLQAAVLPTRFFSNDAVITRHSIESMLVRFRLLYSYNPQLILLKIFTLIKGASPSFHGSFLTHSNLVSNILYNLLNSTPFSMITALPRSTIALFSPEGS